MSYTVSIPRGARKSREFRADCQSIGCVHLRGQVSTPPETDHANQNNRAKRNPAEAGFRLFLAFDGPNGFGIGSPLVLPAQSACVGAIHRSRNFGPPVKIARMLINAT